MGEEKGKPSSAKSYFRKIFLTADKKRVNAGCEASNEI
jgi:hypothetical protein